MIPYKKTMSNAFIWKADWPKVKLYGRSRFFFFAHSLQSTHIKDNLTIQKMKTKSIDQRTKWMMKENSLEKSVETLWIWMFIKCSANLQNRIKMKRKENRLNWNALAFANGNQLCLETVVRTGKVLCSIWTIDNNTCAATEMSFNFGFDFALFIFTNSNYLKMNNDEEKEM